MNGLLTWDLRLFFYINSKWTNGFFDFLLPWLRELVRDTALTVDRIYD